MATRLTHGASACGIFEPSKEFGKDIKTAGVFEEIQALEGVLSLPPGIQHHPQCVFSEAVHEIMPEWCLPIAPTLCTNTRSVTVRCYQGKITIFTIVKKYSVPLFCFTKGAARIEQQDRRFTGCTYELEMGARAWVGDLIGAFSGGVAGGQVWLCSLR